ncbi:hypothetical protein VTK73DRAFT_3715 [Phialemonium thermophilum]|uniref:Uncharacterized protein n=1 Tax=Phialemonium thermophilum TaxID=223376 RepID=A0ABR3VFK2_9PEZI
MTLCLCRGAAQPRQGLPRVARRCANARRLPHGHFFPCLHPPGRISPDLYRLIMFLYLNIRLRRTTRLPSAGLYRDSLFLMGIGCRRLFLRPTCPLLSERTHPPHQTCPLPRRRRARFPVRRNRPTPPSPPAHLENPAARRRAAPEQPPPPSTSRAGRPRRRWCRDDRLGS